MVVFACWGLMFFLLPESFWDRTPHPKNRRTSAHSRQVHSSKMASSTAASSDISKQVDGQNETPCSTSTAIDSEIADSETPKPPQALHVKFARDGSTDDPNTGKTEHRSTKDNTTAFGEDLSSHDMSTPRSSTISPHILRNPSPEHIASLPTPGRLHSFNSPFYQDIEKVDSNYFHELHPGFNNDGQNSVITPELTGKPIYTPHLKSQPTLTFAQQLKPYNGRLTNDNFFKVMLRPFILFAYPAVLWSAVVYSCSVGWLIVLSESVAEIYRKPETYNFSALSTGLVYLSPFIGGVLGTAVAGKVSDIIVRYMSKRNGGLYEPEFRLVMALPVAITTVIGLMGFGWSAHERDSWIVPTVFFGIISFGCCLGSTTAITFCVDSYRQYAGEALVTLNFSKNIFHGLVFSLFVNHWLERDGSKSVFIWLGVIQLILMAFTVPMYIFGKRARMWTVRMNLMERF